MTDVFSKLQSAAHAGAFGAGSNAQPTPEQIRAGNYAKGSLRLHGLRITIETPMFQSRRGKQDAKPWEVLCMAHYGYVNGTKGADGDAVDVFVGPIPESLRVYVINQVNKDGGFDEHKVMLGFTDQEQACTAYMNSYVKGWTGLGSVAACTIKQFKYWLKHCDLSQPLSADLPNIPEDETLTMTDVFTRWGADNLPEGSTVAEVLYELRRNDTDGLLMDSASLGDVSEDLSDGGMLDAMVIEYKVFERKGAQLLRVMQAAAGEVKATGIEVTKPFKKLGTTQVAMQFAMSDGQSVTVFFHNPDSTPNKLTPSDELISWKWVLNKRDITATVAPERGQDLNPRIVARRIMSLVERNSAKFIKANENKATQDAALNDLKASVEAKTAEVGALDAEILDLTAQLEQKKAAPTGGEPGLFNEPPPPTDTRDNLAKFTDALKAGDIDTALKVVEGIEGVDDLRELVLKAGFSLGASATKADIMAGVGSALVRAAKAGVDGTGLRELDKKPAAKPAPTVGSTILDDYPEVAALGSATVASVGSENVYFEKDGAQYMTKLLNTDDYADKVGQVVDLSGVVDPSAVQGKPATGNTEFNEAYPAWETAVVDTLAELMGISSGDAQGVVMAQDTMLSQLYVAEKSPQEAAQAIWDAAKGEPEESGTEPKLVFTGATLVWSEGSGDENREFSTLADLDAWFKTTYSAEHMARESGAYSKNKLVIRVTDKDGNKREDTTRVDVSRDKGDFNPTQETIAQYLSENGYGGITAGAAVVESAPAEPDEETEDTGTIEADGRDNTVKTAKGTKVVTGFKVIEAKKLIISHESDGTVNPDYPAEIQPRDRARTTSQAWVQKTARSLDPDSLGKTQRADTGAPIVGPDRVVESGNGRAMAIREAYRIGQADEYREWLIENAEYFGVDVAKIQRFKAPVLVRVRKTDVNRVEFAVESNQDDKLAMTATEKARSDAKRLDTAMLAKLADGDLNSASNRDFVAAFLQSLGDAEAAQYLTSDGKPTSSLISRLQAALFAGAYSDDRLLEMTADVAKPEIANIVSALNMAAPDFMRAKEQDRVGGEQAGEQLTDSVELSLNQEAVNAIIGATNVLQRAKESGMGVDEFIRQGDMFGGTDPAIAAMAIFISQNNRSAKRMGTAFKAMAQFVESENARKQTAGLFGDEPASFTDIVGAANRKLEQEYGEGLFAIDQGDMFNQQPKTPEQAPAQPETEPNEDDNVQKAKAYLDSIIDGTADLASPDLLPELERIYVAYGEGELRELFTEASDAYRDHALKATAGAF